VPNTTVAQINKETAEKLVKVMGSVSVSLHEDRNVCYESIRLLKESLNSVKKPTLKQINMHVLVSMETLQSCYDALQDSVVNSNLQSSLNSVVLLALKPKGRGVNFNSLPQKEFQKLIKYAFSIGAKIGFDSCNCHRFLECVKDHPRYNDFKLVAEPCESACFSGYISVNGNFFPCSFLEGTSEWEQGISLKNVLDFQKEVWYAPNIVKFRRKLIRNKRHCPRYDI
jgi:hypothetical protein